MAAVIGRDNVRARGKRRDHLIPEPRMKAGRVEQEQRWPVPRRSPFEPADVAFRRLPPVLPGFVPALALRHVDDTDAGFFELLVADPRRGVPHTFFGLTVSWA